MKNNKLIKIFSAIALVLVFSFSYINIAKAATQCSYCDPATDCITTISTAGASNKCGPSASGQICVKSSATPATCIAGTMADTIKGVGSSSGLATDVSVPTMVGNVIRIILGISGTAALIIVVVGGVKWMTSGGNETKITSARKLMVSGAIGI
ncbi:hypothetical protein EOM09_01535, partial [bacterium]|nr:hypothetical protein [bacterium]